jgi:hypothetical protein
MCNTLHMKGLGWPVRRRMHRLRQEHAREPSLLERLERAGPG